jgi:hypothetical protein
VRTALLLSLLPLAGAAAPPDGGDVLVVVTAHWRDRAQLQQIGARLEHVRVDEKAHTAQAEASREDYLALRRAGIAVEIDDPATERLRQAEAGLHAAFARRQQARMRGVLPQEGAVYSQESIPNYACYRTVEETYATMDTLASAHSMLAKVVDIGPSWLASRGSGGYRMRALELTNARTNAALPNKPTMVVFASIHAREYTPAELLTRFGEWLVNGYGRDAQATWLMDNFKFDLVLQANPDGRKKAESGLSWRKNVDDLNGTCSSTTYGIDLNRNFNFRWNSVSGGSSGDACNIEYRGPSSMSEAETKNLLRYVAGTPDTSGVYRGGALPDRRNDDTVSASPSNYQGMFLDLHSYSQLVLWPWSFSSTAPPNAGPLRTLGRRLAYFNGYKPEQWIGLYAADGTDTDTVYGRIGAPSYTIELGVAFFEDCNTFETSTYPKNIAAIRYAARNLWAPYVYPSGPDTTALAASPGLVVPGNVVTVSATVDDSTFNQSAGSEPVQAIASVQAFVDQTPWASGATARAMVPLDGRFDTSRETAVLHIDTSRMAPGRHVVYVRGVDGGSHAGTPQAAYFIVAKVQAMELTAQPGTATATHPGAPPGSASPQRMTGTRDAGALRPGMRQN